MTTDHSDNLYIILLNLSRNKFFYSKLKLEDVFQTRLYLMFFHFSILMICFKKKGKKFNQKTYDVFFHNIENNLRELGFGDVTVNKKMKEFNKILYDILLKLDNQKMENNTVNINKNLIKNYFSSLNSERGANLAILSDYLLNFFNFCFEKPLNTVIEQSSKFKYYGSS